MAKREGIMQWLESLSDEEFAVVLCSGLDCSKCPARGYVDYCTEALAKIVQEVS